MARFFPDSIQRNLNSKIGETVSVLDFGAVGTGLVDDAVAINKGINSIMALAATLNIIGGIDLYFPGGYTYLINSPIKFPAGMPPVTLSGDGVSTKILVGNSLSPGHGAFDIFSQHVRLSNFMIDGQKLVSDRLKYGRDFNGIGGLDPMADSLSLGTSIWIHPGAHNCTIDSVTIQHTQGYAILADARTAQLNDVTILNCWFLNNRPSLFGTNDLDLNYGSWNGGVMLHGDGRLGAAYAVAGFAMRDCHFRRCTGNCIWAHQYGFEASHSHFTVSNCTAIDCGLDFIQPGVCIGGAVTGNYARRIGYICSDDNSPSIPKWLSGAWASGLDASGYTIGVDYIGNTLISVNGDSIDLDGFAEGSVVGNVCKIPQLGERAYLEDSIYLVGWAGSTVAGGPNFSHGIISSNSLDQEPGGDSITIVGNTFMNISGGAILIYAGRRCLVTSNNIDHPSNATQVPIVLGNVGTGANQRAYDSAVYGNRIKYTPATPKPCVFEDDSIAPFNATDVNFIGSNIIIPNTGTAYGFQGAPGHLSAGITRYDSNAPQLLFPSFHYIQREGFGDNAVLRWYFSEQTNAPRIHMQLQANHATGAAGPLLNVSVNGVAHTGIVTTGSRVNSAWPDAVLSGKGYFDSFVALTDVTFTDFDADQLGGTIALLRFKSSVGHIEQSITVASGHRVWTPLTGGGGGGSVAGADTQVQYNKSGVMFADANFTWDYTNKILTLTDSGAGGGLVVNSSSSAAVNVPNGTVQANNLTTKHSLYFVESSAPSAALGIAVVYADTSSHFLKVSLNNGPFYNLGVVTSNADQQVLFNATGTIGGQSQLTYDYTNHVLSLNDTGSSSGLAVLSSSTAAVNVPNGSVQAKNLVTLHSVYWAETAAPAAAPGIGIMHFDNVFHIPRISINGGPFVPVALLGMGIDTPSSGVITVDLQFGKTHKFVQDGTVTTVAAPIYTNGAVLAGERIWIVMDQDGSGLHNGPTFNSVFASDVGTQVVSGTASTRTTWQLLFDGTKWTLEAFRTGGAIT